MQPQAQNIIFGVDIVKGSSRSREAPRYAVVILNGLNGDTERFPSVSRFKLLRMIRQYSPDMLAVDSIQELAPNRKELISFLKRLPPEVKLIQVTGNEHQEPLTRLGKEKGIAFNPLIPDEEAFACACLAAMGVGYIVSVFEDRTVIKVSRARSPGRGGWSQNRYRRKVQGKVREKVREIEQKLRDTDYEARVTEGFGGLVNGTFVVNSKRSDLGIHNSREEDVQVSVTSVEKDKIEFIPLERKNREHIIVGVDPGTTIGVAVLNLDGELKGLVSSRMMSVPDIVSYIREKGKPVVVATDVVPPPATVEKIKRSFKATLFAPNERIAVEEKVKLAKPYGYGNDHERDALAAAVKAFNAYKNKFAQIDRKAPAHMTDDVKAMAVGGKAIDAAIEMLRPRPEKPHPQERAALKPQDAGNRGEGRGDAGAVATQGRADTEPAVLRCRPEAGHAQDGAAHGMAEEDDRRSPAARHRRPSPYQGGLYPGSRYQPVKERGLRRAQAELGTALEHRPAQADTGAGVPGRQVAGEDH